MLDEIIRRLTEGDIYFSQTIIRHYAQDLSTDESEASLQPNLEAHVARLYTLTNTQEVLLNLFVAPLILKKLTPQKTIEFMNLIINPLMNSLPWTRVALAGKRPFDIHGSNVNVTECSGIVEEYLSKKHPHESLELETANYINTLLTLTITSLFQNEIKVIIKEHTDKKVEPSDVYRILEKKLTIARFCCLLFLKKYKFSHQEELSDFIHGLLTLLVQLDLADLDGTVRSSCFDSVCLLFDEEIDVSKIKEILFLHRTAEFVTKYKEALLFTPPMEFAFDKILRLALIGPKKLLMILSENDDARCILTGLIQFILLARSDAEAEAKLRPLMSGLTTTEELILGPPLQPLIMLSNAYVIYHHSARINAIRILLIEYLSTPERLLTIDFSSFLKKKHSSQSVFSQLALKVIEANDLRVALAICLSTVQSRHLSIQKRAILELLTPEYELEGICNGWDRFSKNISIQPSPITAQILENFNTIFLQPLASKNELKKKALPKAKEHDTFENPLMSGPSTETLLKWIEEPGKPQKKKKSPKIADEVKESTDLGCKASSTSSALQDLRFDSELEATPPLTNHYPSGYTQGIDSA